MKNATSNAYYLKDTPSSGVYVCWFEHSNLSFGNGCMTLNYGIGTLTTKLYFKVFFFTITENESKDPKGIENILCTKINSQKSFLLNSGCLSIFP